MWAEAILRRFSKALRTLLKSSVTHSILNVLYSSLFYCKTWQVFGNTIILRELSRISEITRISSGVLYKVSACDFRTADSDLEQGDKFLHAL